MRAIKLNSFSPLTCGLTLDIAPAGLETVGWPLESRRRPDLDRALNGRLLELLPRVARVGLTLVMWAGEHGVGGSPLRHWLGCLGSSEEVSDPV